MDPKEENKNSSAVFTVSEHFSQETSNGIDFKDVTKDQSPANFEQALDATGFGKFNYILVISSMTLVWAQNIESSAMSFVVPAAECDLHLGLFDKGLINAVGFAGMVSTGFIWGYLCDTLGRRKVIIIGLAIDGVMVFLSSLTQNVTFLLVMKFLGGVIINGPFSALISYLAEMNGAKYRNRIQMVLGIYVSTCNIIMPLLAWLILPLDVHLVINNYFHYHAWNLYISIISLPAVLSATIFYFFPESPKFLMAIGQREKALEVFRTIYRINTGKPAETFPVLELIDETQTGDDKLKGRVTVNRTNLQALREGFRQISPLFFPPYLLQVVTVCLLQFLILGGGRTLNLWLPQILQTVNDYETAHNGSASFCTMLESLNDVRKTETEECIVNVDNSFVYTNTAIIAAPRIFFFALAGTLINIVGGKSLLFVSCVISGISAVSLYWSQDNITTIVLLATCVSLIGVSAQIVLSLVVVLFPTIFRTFTVSLVLAIGRTGATSGNLIFPVLLQMGCGPPFFFITGTLIICIVLINILPKTNSKPLQ